MRQSAENQMTILSYRQSATSTRDKGLMKGLARRRVDGDTGTIQDRRTRYPAVLYGQDLALDIMQPRLGSIYLNEHFGCLCSTCAQLRRCWICVPALSVEDKHLDIELSANTKYFDLNCNNATTASKVIVSASSFTVHHRKREQKAPHYFI